MLMLLKTLPPWKNSEQISYSLISLLRSSIDRLKKEPEVQSFPTNTYQCRYYRYNHPDHQGWVRPNRGFPRGGSHGAQRGWQGGHSRRHHSRPTFHFGFSLNLIFWRGIQSHFGKPIWNNVFRCCSNFMTFKRPISYPILSTNWYFHSENPGLSRISGTQCCKRSQCQIYCNTTTASANLMLVIILVLLMYVYLLFSDHLSKLHNLTESLKKWDRT